MTNQETIKTYRLLHQSVQVCHAHGVENVVLCPGSRSAPLALSFMRFEGIKHFVIPDERSAAYTALGMARQTKKPVALVCTSGTAALNFAPAVAEAFFSEIPLIVFTADRPAEWIGQADNQAVSQKNLYGVHVKAMYDFPADFSNPDLEWFAIRSINEAMNLAMQHPRGPVHINVPLREPLYLGQEPDFKDETPPKIVRFQPSDKTVPESIIDELSQYKKVLVVAGAHRPNALLNDSLSKLCTDSHIVFVPDITSNLLHTSGAIAFSEQVVSCFSHEDMEMFVPELVISFGGPIVSKTLKNFLRHKDIKTHWCLNGHPASADTFQNLTTILEISAPAFFSAIAQKPGFKFDKNYFHDWAMRDKQAALALMQVTKEDGFSEAKAVFTILQKLPKNSVLHLGNSMPIRHVTAFPSFDESVEVYSNRGTSGIDGTVSAAAGQSMVDDRNHVLIVGDLGFMYDSNGLWNNYLHENLKIIVFNNHGGGIFRTLPGAKSQKELEEYFVVKQPLRFEHIVLQHDCHYLFCDKAEGIGEALQALFAAKGRPAVLEIEFGGRLSIEEVKKKISK